MQEALCSEADSLWRLGKVSGARDVDTPVLLKYSIFYQFSDVYFSSPATTRQQNCIINYSKRYIFIPQFIASVLWWGDGQKKTLLWLRGVASPW